MPNLRPPVTTAAAGRRLPRAHPRRRARRACASSRVMSLYLTDKLPPEEIARAAAAGVRALKLYPAGATTNSDAGVTDIRKTYATLEAMQKHGLLLLVHGEVTDPAVDLFDREAVFIDRVMIPLRRDFPELKVVFEHLTTKEGAALRARCRPLHRRHHHRAPPALQPQRDLHRRHPAALLLPAGAQARDAPRRAGRGRHQRQRPLLPRHRQRAAPGAPEGARARLRRLLHRAHRDRAVRRGLRQRRRARQARRLRELPRRRLLRPAAQHRHRDAAARKLDRARDRALRRRHAEALARRRNASPGGSHERARRA